ncbi:heme NO-binding domain-containing protein [Flavobacterium psychrophilum]|uniref:Heme NO-binding domain-containing protein n=2 Tax=Flavobacterium psychrophilum TaxID=96345 RepID=A6GYD7_FLAPJ|nr:heme NO-binding domain-containing protein [Flavobacterium psychrophilum]AIG29826.1 heme NO-binding protein [Flavobacterium psychrophilum]AIG32103.1 heme NO-binding protein [Flavobacterium psychrophilum]AIG34258.1 heme NO-binding protein [Flavobacterium psychrophilum]AIG36621.1 heme NO-binding protein [Flavobacterium psychrophilum]AIG38886.1 heme NO-binding protein [Flavobacterium psychrophilum]
MYGIVNKAIEDLVIANFGEAKWNAIKDRTGIDIDFFISNEPYDDEITFKLALAVSQEMNMTINQVLITFGEWWVIKTTSEKYPGLMNSGGNNLRDFLVNLPNFHNRVMLIYPKLTPPEFKISNITENGLNLHYFSKRQGLQEFVRGLIQGLGKMFNTQVTIALIQTRNQGSTHEIFKINW